MFNGITRRRTKLRPVAAIALLCAVVVISACSTATTGNQGGDKVPA